MLLHSDDMQFLGFKCEYDKAPELKEKEWIKITAEVRKALVPEYQGVGPLLNVVELEHVSEPKNPVIDFSNPEV